MSWAGRRRFLILSIVAIVGIFIVAVTSIATFYKAPSCADHTQNQGETGIDCGGPCAYLCVADEQIPIVRFTKALLPTPNRVDIISYIDNPNASASARSVPFKVTLYAADHTVLKTDTGTVDMPAGATVPVYIPSFFTGNAEGVQAFITIDAPDTIKWYTDTSQPKVPNVAGTTLGGTNDAPRITAVLGNPNAAELRNVKAVVAVYNGSNNVIAASETLVLSIPPQGSASAIFTWNDPFTSPPARIEVIPLVSLSP